MTQEVEVTLTLEVDAYVSNNDLKDYIEYLFKRHSLVTLVNVKSIKEEAELYGNK